MATANGSPQRKVFFGPFELDMCAGELRKNGTKVRLQPQAFQILAALLDRPGEVVSREELCRRLWDSATFVDFGHSLAAAVKRLRDSLGDSAHPPKFIETVGRSGAGVTGYKFIGALVKNARSEKRSTVAVLPFTGPAGEADAMLLDGLTDEIQTRLAQLDAHRLAVIARTSTLLSMRAEDPLQAARTRLNADLVLNGVMRKAGERCRISVQLIDCEDRTMRWAHTYDLAAADLDEPVRVQCDLARRAVTEIASKLFPGENLKSETSDTNFKAYECYMRGRYHWTHGGESGFHLTNKYYMDAIAIEPRFARAYAGLADSYHVYTMYASGLNSDMPYAEAAAMSRQFAKRALEIDPELPEGHAALAFSLMQHDWDWPAAKDHYEQAIRINPNSVYAHHWYGWALLQAGEFDACVEEMETAKRLDPLCPSLNANYGWMLYMMRRNAAAITQLESALDFPEHPFIFHSLALAYHAAGRVDEAITVLRRAMPLDGVHPITVATMVALLSAAGNTNDAIEMLCRLEEMAKTRMVSPWQFARAYGAVGKDSQAFASLEQAIDERSGWVPHLELEPMFDGIRRDPRWPHLLKRRMRARGASVAA